MVDINSLADLEDPIKARQYIREAFDSTKATFAEEVSDQPEMLEAFTTILDGWRDSMFSLVLAGEERRQLEKKVELIQEAYDMADRAMAGDDGSAAHDLMERLGHILEGEGPEPWLGSLLPDGSRRGQ